MKKRIIVVSVILGMQACDMKVAKHQNAANATTAKQSRFANTKDYNCGMDTEDSYTDTTIYKGKVYGFCSATCKREFDKNKSKYAGE